MAFIQCNFFSHTLGIASSMNVILPQQQYTGDGNTRGEYTRYPVLYLLHGLSGDHTAWQRNTSIERYVAPLKLAVIMPAANRSFYSDVSYGYKYWTFISEELPFIAATMFPISQRREDTFVAGLSMGGYGAFKLALRYPERFAAAASLSGALDMASRAETVKEVEFDVVFGDVSKVRGSDNDLFYLAESVAASNGPKPKLFQCCGTEDFLYEDNIRFRDFCRKLHLDLTYEEEPGEHEWGYWDRKIKRVLEWLPLK